jgi:hypothetical protein
LCQMSKPPPFALPAGLEIELAGDVLSIGYEGDVHLEQSLGRTLGEVFAGGDLTVQLDVITGQLRCQGRLELRGRIEADTLHGREVIIGDTEVRCRAISADERIVIGQSRLQVDVILAPEIVFDPKASGRVTVIESHNDPGPTKIKGGFSLQEYEEVFGDATAFLTERGVTPLDGEPPPRAPAPKPTPRAKPEKAASTAAAVPTPAPAPTPAPPSTPAPAPARGAAITPAPLGPRTNPPLRRAEEETADPPSLSIDDLQPITDADQEDDLHPKLLEQVKRVASCYDGKEMPPAVGQLRELVEARNYDRLRENITDVWNGLLSFHQRKGIRPHPQVTHAFNVIHGLMQDS